MIRARRASRHADLSSGAGVHAGVGVSSVCIAGAAPLPVERNHGIQRMMRSRPFRAFVFAAAAALGVAAPASAVAQGNGSLAGHVTSASGAPVADAAVTATSAAGEERRARPGADGAWRIARVAPGRWTVRAARMGFAGAEQAVDVAAGAEARVELRLAEAVVALDPLEAVSRRDAERERPRFGGEAGGAPRAITRPGIQPPPPPGAAPR